MGSLRGFYCVFVSTLMFFSKHCIHWFIGYLLSCYVKESLCFKHSVDKRVMTTFVPAFTRF